MREFYGPFAKTLKKADADSDRVQVEAEVTDIPCDKCGRMMVIKFGRFGKFLACPGYPECKNAKPIIETVEVPCPVCGGKVQIRKSKAGKKYYICENNTGIGKGCNYISWNPPVVGEKFVPSPGNEVVDLEGISDKEEKTTKKQTKKATKKNK